MPPLSAEVGVPLQIPDFVEFVINLGLLHSRTGNYEAGILIPQTRATLLRRCLKAHAEDLLGL